MPPLPVLSGKEVIRAFAKLGWEVARQKDSHTITVKEGEVASLSVPNHKEVASTLRSLIRSAGLTAREFESAL